VQRWLYFCKFLERFGIKPFVITVDEKKASYKFIDKSFAEKVKHVEVYRTNTVEPLKIYSRLLSGDSSAEIPQGFAGESSPNIFQKISRFVRGNFFLPDARVGWNRFALKKAEEIIRREKIKLVITTGPPQSTHLIGLKLKKKMNVKWIADFRDPWTEIYYNSMLYKTSWAKKYEEKREKQVLNAADGVIAIGPGLRNLLQRKVGGSQPEKFHFVYNGYDQDAFEGLQRTPDKDHFTICHIGILSDNQPVTAFLNALQKFLLKHDNKISSSIRLKFVGKVSPGIMQEINMLVPGIEAEIISYLPHKEALIHMQNADLLLNSFAISAESDILVSGKLMEYIATGNPILALGNTNGDAASLLQTMAYAKIFERKDVNGISDFIENIYGHWKNGKSFEKLNTIQYSRLETTRQLATILNKYI